MGPAPLYHVTDADLKPGDRVVGPAHPEHPTGEGNGWWFFAQLSIYEPDRAYCQAGRPEPRTSWSTYPEARVDDEWWVFNNYGDRCYLVTVEEGPIGYDQDGFDIDGLHTARVLRVVREAEVNEMVNEDYRDRY